MSKLALVDGRCYDLEVSAASDKLTLVPCSLPLGYVTNRHEGLCAVVLGKHGCLKIRWDRSGRVALPVGDWRLLFYTIYRDFQDPTPRLDEQPEGQRSLASGRPRGTLLRVQGTKQCKPITVRKGETVPLPFGPPFRTEVELSHLYGDNKERASLRMRMIGSGGEFCTSLGGDRRRTGEPQLTISTPGGKVVERGHFTEGCDIFPRWYMWKVPAEGADEYHLRVDWKDGPFEMVDTGYSVIRASELRPR